MKKVVLFLAIIFSIVSLGFSQSNEEKQVAQAVETLKKALLDGNKAALEGITAAELSYGHSGGKIEDKAAFVQALSSGSSDFVTIELSEQTIKVVGNTALVRHKLNGTNNDGGVAGVVKLGVLLVWTKQNGNWKLLARQAFKLP